MTGPTLWLDPGFGASGDMLLGALIGLGAPLDEIRADIASLGVDGWTIDVEPTERAGISATRAVVKTTETHHHRPWSAIDRQLADASLPAPVAAGARRTFQALAEAEAGIHGVSVDDVHFHEVGALDAIVDIVGTWSAVHHLGPAAIHAAPVGLGSGGTVDTAHGQLPVPAPATASLLVGVPVRGLDTPSETVTPTGAALLTSLVGGWGPIPAGTLRAVARGAGGRNPSTHPNVLGAFLLDHPLLDTALLDDPHSETVTAAVVLATNIDDATPEVLGHTIDRLLATGADDAWLVPIGMKKNRPGHELRVLAALDLVDDLRAIIFAETGTLGLRISHITKHALDRRFDSIKVRGCPIRMKIGPYGAKPEHEDLIAASQATGLAIRALAAEALATWTSISDPST